LPAPPDGAIESCRQAFAAVAASGDVASTVPGIFTGCADLHAAPGCREAWRTAASVSPEMRIAVVAAGCQRAYCPTLSPPRPTLCEHEVSTMSPSELGPAWAELERLVLARDLGDVGAALGAGLTRLATPIVVPVTQPAAPPDAGTSVTLVVKREGPALVVLRLDDPSRRATIPADADAAALADRLRPLVAGVERVALAADRSLPYQDVVRVLDGLTTTGITRFSIVVEPQPTP